ncbi:MAG TPA: DUF6293 family protein [Methanocorpusculum sp.]|nr:DUF6293 family protein [Methanocorpusculum sp.]
MIKRLRSIVHIVPLSGSEKRAASVYETSAADRVHLIVRKKSAAWKNFCELLAEKNIAAETTVCDLSNPIEFLSCITSLIAAENPAYNSVYVNIAAAGPMCAGISSLAAMAQKAAVYSVESGEIVLLPEMDVVLPEEQETEVLGELVFAEDAGESLSATDISGILEHEDEEDDELDECGKITICACRPMSLMQTDCVAEESRILYPAKHPSDEQKQKRAVQSRNLMKVSSFMRRMEEKGYVEKKKEGRKMLYRVTEKGRYAYYLTGKKNN